MAFYYYWLSGVHGFGNVSKEIVLLFTESLEPSTYLNLAIKKWADYLRAHYLSKAYFDGHYTHCTELQNLDMSEKVIH